MSLTSEATTSMTLGQFMEEAELFTVSKEYFDMMKESSEVCLLEQYLACQEYLLENSDDISDDTKASLITESADNIDQIYESAEEKKSGLWSKIKAGFMKVVNAIITFFSRLVNFWKNGKELEKLRAKAKFIEKVSEEKSEQVAKHIQEILRGKQHAVDNLRAKVKEKDDKIANLKDHITIISATKDAEIARVHKMFKGVNPELYRELQEVEKAIAEEITVRMPRPTGEIDDYTAEVAKAIDSYKVIRGAYAGNKNTHLKHARVISDLLKKLKASRNEVVTKTINPAWLEETYRSLVASKEKITAAMSDITDSFNSAHDTKDRIDTTKNEKIHGIRTSADANFMELQRNLTGLLNEWIYLANSSIKSMKELIDIRNHNIGIEHQILDDIRRAA